MSRQPAARPLWFSAICIVMCLPALLLPFAGGMEPVRQALGVLFTLFPVYVCSSALCAWLCMPQRRDVAWILIALAALAYLALTLLARSYGH